MEQLRDEVGVVAFNLSQVGGVRVGGVLGKVGESPAGKAQRLAALRSAVDGCAGSTLDVKPSSPVGDLISDQAWHGEVSIVDLREWASNHDDHALVRESNLETTHTQLLSSAQSHTSLGIDSGHEARRARLLTDRKVSDDHSTVAGKFTHGAGQVEFYRSRMVDAAMYGEYHAQVAEHDGDSDKARDIRADTRSEVDGLGSELGGALSVACSVELCSVELTGGGAL